MTTMPPRRPASLFEEHLGLDAVVAFSDGELGLTAFGRAAAHLARCAACAREVEEQDRVRRRLRSAPCPPMPTALMSSLLSIPLALPVPPHPTRPAHRPADR